MPQHSCAFCRVAREMNSQQIQRYLASGKDPEEFLNDPREDQWSSDQNVLMMAHEKIKIRERRMHQ